MDDLKAELKELKEFIGDLKADRAASKEKEKREGWTKYVSLSLVIIAVLASVASQWGGKYSGRVQMNQAQASDDWNGYQAESIKKHIYDISRKQLAGNATDAMAQQRQAEFEAKTADYDKKQINWANQAHACEAIRNAASKKGGYMGTSISFFSISIAVASTCLVTKKKPLWFLSLILAVAAVSEMIYAWTL
jgi:hypothetical protein